MIPGLVPVQKKQPSNEAVFLLRYCISLFLRIRSQCIPDGHEDAENNHEAAGGEDEELLQLRSKGCLFKSLDENQDRVHEDHGEGREEEGGREPMAEAVEAGIKSGRAVAGHKSCIAAKDREQDEPGKRSVKETRVMIKEEEAEKGPGDGADQEFLWAAIYVK